MAYTYLIDAYNILHHSRSLGPLIESDFESARNLLIDRIARFCGVTGERAKLVFDGQGRRAESRPPDCGVATLEIVYAPANNTADAWIERHVYQADDKRAIIVVSGDRGIRDFCMGVGTLVMKPDHFLEMVRSASTEVSDSARQTVAREGSLGGIESRLSDEALTQLDALRKKLRP